MFDRGRAVAVCRWLLVMAALVVVSTAEAQQTGATITGVVRDSASRPIADADVVARPGARRTRTDSAGRFILSGLDGGKYTVVARKVGYAPVDWEVSLSSNGSVDIKLVLDRRMPLLDTVVVAGKRECSRTTFEGFICRRRFGGGVFLDYNEIDEKEPLYTADIFRDIKGFRVDLRRTRSGLTPVAVHALPWGCVTSLVDGRMTSGATFVPDYPWDLMAVEIYTRPDSVPKEYQEHTWPRSGSVTRSGRCSVVVYWTTRAKLKP